MLNSLVESIRHAITNELPITVHTSGTTGQPRPFTRTLPPLNRVLLTYSPERWAGVSVIDYAIRSGSILITPDDLTPSAIAKAGINREATHLPITPSMFKLLPVVIPTIKQITFGGEYATQAVLDYARRLYPTARISHVYASAEMGDICCASDGIEGFSKLPTVVPGDIWEKRNDRYYFVGRDSDLINVGGNKVSPLAVEQASGCLQSRAYAVPSPLLGSVIGFDYVDGYPDFSSLPKYARPMLVRKVDSLTLNNGKLKR